MMTEPTQRQPCGFEWSDGWGEHECHRIKGHEGDHGCRCDATVRSRE